MSPLVDCADEQRQDKTQQNRQDNIIARKHLGGVLEGRQKCVEIHTDLSTRSGLFYLVYLGLELCRRCANDDMLPACDRLGLLQHHTIFADAIKSTAMARRQLRDPVWHTM